MKQVKSKHVPMRMCKICRQRSPKEQLQRYVFHIETKKFVLDNKKIIAGRGVYICSKPECYTKFHLGKERGKRGL